MLQTHCRDRGVQTFCCTGVPFSRPTCRWRGHRNSGHCKPGCNSDEAEVGTLNVGCKTAHQSACCTLTPSVAAYGECKWSGSAPLCSADPKSSEPSRAACPDLHTHFIFAASASFGGEKLCDTGQYTEILLLKAAKLPRRKELLLQEQSQALD